MTVHDRQGDANERPEPANDPDEPRATVGERLVAAVPSDTFAELCGRGGLAVEVVTTDGAALWRGHPWGDGWTGAGTPEALARLVAEYRPAEMTVPATLGLPPGYASGWGWGWHATRMLPREQPGESTVGWLDEDDELRQLMARAFPDAETPPGDPRVARWFGARSDGRLVAVAAALRTEPGAALLSSLAVDPTVRRGGWGKAVTAWFARTRLAEGASVVGLGTYLGNEPARALYRSVGFADVPYVGGRREP